MFKAIDENGDGSVSFDEWLGFAYKNYQVAIILFVVLGILMATFYLLKNSLAGFFFFLLNCVFGHNNSQGQKDLPAAFDKQDKDQFVADCKEVSQC